jgi:multidrug efflux system membrane fusion protein
MEDFVSYDVGKFSIRVMKDPVSPTAPSSTKGRAGCFIVLLALLSGGGWWWWTHHAAGTAVASGPAKGGKGGMRGGGGPVPVSVEEVKQQDFEEWISNGGTVTPLSIVTVRSRVDGELIKVHFKEGQLLKEGDLLAEIDPRPFKVALEQAKGALARDQALQDNARADLDRYQALLKQDSIAKQQVDTQASLVRQYDAAIITDNAAIASAELQMSYTKIVSPIAGRAGLRQIDAGNMIRSNDVNGLVVVTQVNPMGLVFSIPQERVDAVRKRLSSSDDVPVEAMDRQISTLLGRGRLLTTDNQIDLTSGTLKLKAELPNDDGALFPNQFIITRLLVNVEKNATVAPATAIQRGSRGTYAYVLENDGTVSLHNVTTGATHGDRILIRDGLRPGDKVVTQGVDRLRDGGKVEVIPRGGTPAAPLAEGKRGKGPPPLP